MKLRTGIAVCLLAAAFAFACGANRYLTGACGELIAGLEDALAAEETRLSEKALAQCGAWEEQSARFSILLHHRETDDLSQAFLLLKLQASAGQTDETRAALTRCISLLLVLKNGETLQFSNLL